MASDIVSEPKPKKKKMLKTVAVAIFTTLKAKATIKMDWAIKDCLGKTGDRLDSNGTVIIHMETICRLVQIPMNTFQKYVHMDPNNRR